MTRDSWPTHRHVRSRAGQIEEGQEADRGQAGHAESRDRRDSGHRKSIGLRLQQRRPIPGYAKVSGRPPSPPPQPRRRPRAVAPKTRMPKDDAPGATLVVRDLQTGTDATFGNVSSYAWSEAGTFLAMTISAEGKTGNGVQVFNPATNQLRVLDSGAAIYKGLAWRKDSDDLAVFKSKSDEKFEDDTHVLLAWKALDRKSVFDPSPRPRDSGRTAHRRVSIADLVRRRFGHLLRHSGMGTETREGFERKREGQEDRRRRRGAGRGRRLARARPARDSRTEAARRSRPRSATCWRHGGRNPAPWWCWEWT